MKITIWYRCITECPSSSFELETDMSDFDDTFELQIMAQEAASDYHDCHDGWESSWPLDFTLHKTEDGEVEATFTVERESEPHFYASFVS